MARVRKKRAVLELAEVQAIRRAAAELGPLEHALVEWLYTNGARASEPGLARLSDLDLHGNTVQLHHLKGGTAPEPLPLSGRCRDALRAWLAVRKARPGQEDYVFPCVHPGPCYPCQGRGRLILKRGRKGPREAPCPHCRATGTRQGLNRHEVRRLVERVFAKAGIPDDRRFPHILRHSCVTHMLNRGAPLPEIQERVGHRDIATTYKYMRTTKEAQARVAHIFDED